MSNTEGFFLNESVCKVCGKRNINKHYILQEMFYGTKEEFGYFVCKECNCIQITETPEDLDKYYSNNYYSFENREVSCLPDKPVYLSQNLLDVGCGSGKWLLEMAEQGFGNLYGCDPFIESDIDYGDSVHIRKCDISKMEGEYDVIRLADSFEHMDNPLEVMYHIKRLLKADGQAIIEMPIFPNVAFDTFGVHWWQLDPPRHLIVHSKKSMELLCDEVGFEIKSIQYNSNIGMFITSYLYELGIPLIAHSKELMEKMYTERDMQYFVETAEKMNEKGYGDHAVFFISHKSMSE